MDKYFEVGQEVICVDDKFPSGATPIKEGDHYTIIDSNICPNCKFQVVDIGVRDTEIPWVICRCGHRLPTTVWWFRQNRFVPAEYMDNVNELLNEAQYQLN